MGIHWDYAYCRSYQNTEHFTHGSSTEGRLTRGALLKLGENFKSKNIEVI